MSDFQLHTRVKKSRDYEKSKFGLTVIVCLCLLILLPTSTLALNDTKDKTAEIKRFENKLAKGYASKFCNAIGIGLSKESATRLSIAENINPNFNPSILLDRALKKENLIEEVNEKELVDIITSKIVSDCGYPLGLKNKNDIEEFNQFFLSAKNEFRDNNS